MTDFQGRTPCQRAANERIGCRLWAFLAAMIVGGAVGYAIIWIYGLIEGRF